MSLQKDRGAKLILSALVAGAGVGLSFVHLHGDSLVGYMLPILSVLVIAFGIAGAMLSLLQELTDRVDEQSVKIKPAPGARAVMAAASHG